MKIIVSKKRNQNYKMTVNFEIKSSNMLSVKEIGNRTYKVSALVF